MLSTPDYKFWFVTTVNFYRDEQLKSVEKTLKTLLIPNKSGNLPTQSNLSDCHTADHFVTKDANHDDSVAGDYYAYLSPAKMWIRGTQLLQKPLLHLATQYLNHIPYETIDMDYEPEPKVMVPQYDSMLLR